MLLDSFRFEPAIDVESSESNPAASSGIELDIGEAVFHESINSSPGYGKIFHQIGLAHQVFFHAGESYHKGKKVEYYLDK